MKVAPAIRADCRRAGRRIQVIGMSWRSGPPPRRARPRPAAVALGAEALDDEVEQRAQQQQELADELADLLPELGGDERRAARAGARRAPGSRRRSRSATALGAVAQPCGGTLAGERSAASWVARRRSRSSSRGRAQDRRSPAIEGHAQGAVLERGAGGPRSSSAGGSISVRLWPSTRTISSSRSSSARCRPARRTAGRGAASRRRRRARARSETAWCSARPGARRPPKSASPRRSSIAAPTTSSSKYGARSTGTGAKAAWTASQLLLLALAPGAEVRADLRGEDAVDDHRVGQVAVEVQVGEGPPRLVDDHPVGGHHQPHRDVLVCRAGSRSSRSGCAPGAGRRRGPRRRAARRRASRGRTAARRPGAGPAAGRPSPATSARRRGTTAAAASRRSARSRR